MRGVRSGIGRLAGGLVATLALAGPALAAPRIFSLDQCADQYVLALAPRGEIVALSKRALDADFHRARPRRRPAASARANLEAVLAERPTIAVATGRRTHALPARAAAPRRARWCRSTRRTTSPASRANIRKVAAALGEPAAGEALIARMDAELAAAHGAWGGARALYLTPGGFTAGRGHPGRRR